MSLVAAKMEPAAKAAIIEGLTQALAETAVTTVKAQNFHWNDCQHGDVAGIAVLHYDSTMCCNR